MANHLTALAALPGEQKDGYIQELLKKPVFTHTLRYCQDPVVNAVLSMKESVMEQKGIQFQVKVDIPAKLPFEKVEICAIFGNVLDNAIEASPKGSAIYISSRKAGDYLELLVSNPAPAMSNTEFMALFRKGATTKSSQGDRGFGLYNILRMTERYHGKILTRNEMIAGENYVVFGLLLP